MSSSPMTIPVAIIHLETGCTLAHASMTIAQLADIGRNNDDVEIDGRIYTADKYSSDATSGTLWVTGGATR